MRLGPGRVEGLVEAPPSKSHAQRLVAAALVSEGISRIQGFPWAEDAQAALRVAEALGATVLRDGDAVRIGGGLKAPQGPLDCGESGLCLRMFAPIAALLETPVTLTAEGSLRERPVHLLEGPLRALGAQVESREGKPPLKVRGPLRGGEVDVDGSLSSQGLTGLLMALPRASGDSLVNVKTLQSRSYVRLTLNLLRSFGFQIEEEGDLAAFRIPGGQMGRAQEIRVEGDWSGAAFFLVAGALAGTITVTGLDADSVQGDRAVLEALKRCGARVEATDLGVRVIRHELRPFELDATECPDLFPPLVALAAGCEGISTLRGAQRLRHKESDRALTLRETFGQLGVAIDHEGEVLRVHGGTLRGGETHGHGDHRIAMALAVSSLACPQGVTLHGESCVAKSFPSFFPLLRRVTQGVAP
ncbi:MAG: 3-phosphoshikimate 1-carboxyvinyltransferase [Firmicutes bacterium]|nr:3-phosphoshikimate 1-carboxyvinyltransferase [Bacillota bacterium]